MAATKYTYSVASDFPGGAINTEKLHAEIAASAITIALDRIDRSADVLDIWFKDALPSGDKTILDGDTSSSAGGLIAAHDNSPSESENVPVVFHEPPTVVPFPATVGFKTFFTGKGDDSTPAPPSSGRGEGTAMRLSFVVPGTQTIEFGFNEPVEIHDGQLFYGPVSNFTGEDYFSVGARIPASQSTVNGSGTGNCNSVPTGLGYNIVLPASGNGGNDIDLNDPTKAIPVPSPDKTGYWDVNNFTGAVTPSAKPGYANWNLLELEIKVYWVKNAPLGNPLGVFDVESYKSEWFSHSWKLFLTATKVSSGAGDLTGWLMLFRKYTN